jgi:DNA processing protein
MSTGKMITSTRLSHTQLIDWLRLLRTDGIGPRTFQSLINQFGSASEAVIGLPELARRKGGRIGTIPSVDIAEKELAAAQRMGARFLARGDGAYPKALAAIDSAPPLLAVVGPLDLANTALIAIVGSRNASSAGLRMAEQLAEGFGRGGYGVVSGLARGIDTRAHHASRATGTVGVLAGGLDKLYPEENRKLFEALCAEGAVVSEMPFGWEPRGRDFPRRNRIISGLSLGTVIVEAARKSGSLITARFALEQGRGIFAVPGSPLDPRAEGPNDLIHNDSAKLIRNAQDVMDELNPIRGREFEPPRMEDAGGHEETAPLWDEFDWLDGSKPAPHAPAHPPFDGWEEPTMPMRDDVQPSEAHDLIINLLGFAPTEPDELARAAQLSARQVQVALFELEEEGHIERDVSGRVMLKPKVRQP